MCLVRGRNVQAQGGGRFPRPGVLVRWDERIVPKSWHSLPDAMGNNSSSLDLEGGILPETNMVSTALQGVRTESRKTDPMPPTGLLTLPWESPAIDRAIAATRMALSLWLARIG